MSGSLLHSVSISIAPWLWQRKLLVCERGYQTECTGNRWSAAVSTQPPKLGRKLTVCVTAIWTPVVNCHCARVRYCGNKLLSGVTFPGLYGPRRNKRCGHFSPCSGAQARKAAGVLQRDQGSASQRGFRQALSVITQSHHPRAGCSRS